MILLLRLGDEHYALAATVLREIMRRRSLTPVPAAPNAMLGLLARRGTAVPILDLRIVFGMAPLNLHERSVRFVIVSYEEYEIGLAVDEVLDLIESDPSRSEVISLPGRPVRSMLRIANRPVGLIDLPMLVAQLRPQTLEPEAN